MEAIGRRMTGRGTAGGRSTAASFFVDVVHAILPGQVDPT